MKAEQITKCTICDASFSKKASKKRHEKVFHQNQDQYPCLDCGKKFSLRYHMIEVVMFGLYPVCRVLSLEVVEYSLSCRVLTLVYFSKLVEYSP